MQKRRRPKKHTYGQILKSTAFIGGSSTLNIGIGIIRTKVTAMLLGPAGFGLAGLYGSISTLTQNIAGMGIDRSGVRQIAEAVATGNTNRIAQTVAVLRKTSVVLGSVGALILILFSRQISQITFNDNQHVVGITVLSAAAFLQLASAGQSGLIQGMRRISELDKIAVLGALFGTVFNIPVLYFLRQDGVVLSLVIEADISETSQ